METDGKIILKDNPNAAIKYEGDIWKSLKGNYFLTKEHAISDSVTHQKCKHCSNVHDKMYTMCHVCRHKKDREEWEGFPKIGWDETTPITPLRGDEYFFSSDEVIEYCLNNEVSPTDLLLVVAKKKELPEFDIENWIDSRISSYVECEEMDTIMSKDDIEEINSLVNARLKSRNFYWFEGNENIAIDTTEMERAYQQEISDKC